MRQVGRKETLLRKAGPKSPKQKNRQTTLRPPSRKRPSGEQSISRFVVFARDKGATVRLVGSGPLKYKTMTLTNPERVVVDLEGQWQIKAPGVPKNALVSNVRIGKMADKTRVVIDLNEKPTRARFVLSKDGATWTCAWISNEICAAASSRRKPAQRPWTRILRSCNGVPAAVSGRQGLRLSKPAVNKPSPAQTVSTIISEQYTACSQGHATSSALADRAVRGSPHGGRPAATGSLDGKTCARRGTV